MTTTSSLTRLTAELAGTDFKTVGATQRLQRDMLLLTERAAVDPISRVGLAYCGPEHCARLNCAEACWFGARRRRLLEIQAVYRLLQSCGGPVHEVRVVRGGEKPAGDLATINIASAKQKNQRALDKLYMPSVVAVGMFKASPKPKSEDGTWLCEIHQIVAGAEKDELERVLTAKKYCEGDTVRIKKVESVADTIGQVLRRDVRIWQHPSLELPDEQPNRAQRTEYYAWLLGLPLGARMIRYGCNRAFNQVPRPVQKIKIKVRKKRPHPWWLEDFQFGGDWWERKQRERDRIT